MHPIVSIRQAAEQEGSFYTPKGRLTFVTAHKAAGGIAEAYLNVGYQNGEERVIPVVVRLPRPDADALALRLYQRGTQTLARLKGTEEIVELIEHGHDKEGTPYQIVRKERANLQTLLEMLATEHKQLPRCYVLGYLYSLCNAIQAVHDSGRLCLDLTLTNMVVARKERHQIKLSDPDLWASSAEVQEDTRLFRLNDSAALKPEDRYALRRNSNFRGMRIPETISPPEVIWNDSFSHASDIFSAGIIAYALLATDPSPSVVLHDPNQLGFFDRVEELQHDPQYEMIRKATHPEPHQRFRSAIDMKEALFDCELRYYCKNLTSSLQQPSMSPPAARLPASH